MIAGNITLVIQFAPGTFSRQTTLVQVNLDSDQDASTGVQQGSVGADYAIGLNPPIATQAAILRAGSVGCTAFNPCFSAVASVLITFVADGMQVTVPLSLLGDDDGRMNFRVISYAAAVTVGGLPSSGLDVMPDTNLSPARIQ